MEASFVYVLNPYYLYTEFNNKINNYLLIYISVLVLLKIFLFIQWKRSSIKRILYRGIFLGTATSGSLLAVTAFIYRLNNIKKVADMKSIYLKDNNKFLEGQITHLTGSYDRFIELLTIWGSIVVFLLVIIFLSRRKQALPGFCTGLILTCIISLGLDYFGYKAGLPYLKKYNEIKNTTLQKK